MWAIEILKIAVKWRRFVILNTLIITVLAAAVSFLLPRTYLGRATILPPEAESPLGGLMGLTAGHIAQAVTSFSLPLMATPSDLYASMLESETILKQAVDSLKLQEVYKEKSVWDAVKTLKDHLKVSVEKEGIITIEVSEHKPQLAADIANLLVAKLDDLNRHLQNQKGSENVTFLQNRLAETDSSLDAAQNQLRDFQRANGAIVLGKQSEVMIDNLAQLKAQMTMSEVELDLLKKSLYPGHPELVSKQMSIDVYKSKLREIEQGATGQPDSVLSALDIPLGRIPDLTLQLAVLTRNAKIQEMTYELLSQQIEMARIQEHKDTPTIMVLDHARPPELPIKPRKKVLVIAVFIFSLVGTTAIVVIRETLGKPDSTYAPFVNYLSDTFTEIRRKPLG